jgi:hypothetical protein
MHGVRSCEQMRAIASNCELRLWCGPNRQKRQEEKRRKVEREGEAEERRDRQGDITQAKSEAATSADIRSSLSEWVEQHTGYKPSPWQPKEPRG